MDIKVFSTEAIVEIDGVKYHHHPNGGGMVAETAQVADSVFVGPFAKICGHCKLSSMEQRASGAVASLER